MRTMFKLLTITAWVLTTAVCSVAQSTPGRITGSVSDEKGEPVEYVTVLLRQPQDSSLIAGVVTNAAGQYSFESAIPGKYILTLTFVGYQKQSLPIELQGGVSLYTIPAVILKEDARVLGEVVVRAQKPLIEQDGGKLILNVQNSIIAAGGSAAELLERAPGVSIDQNNQISVNGKTGVNIMIDGKPTYLPPAELATLLRSMNANNIATIEVISNPSARYDASGNAGVINIKLKKNTLEGFNGSVTAGGGYGRYGKANGSVNLNYRTLKWNHFLNYGYTFNKRFADVYTDRVTLRHPDSPGDGDPVYYTQQLDRIQRLPSHTWQGGSEWQWDPQNSIAIITSGSYNERNTDNNSLTQIMSARGHAADSTFTLTNNQRYRWYNVSSSLGYKHLFARTGSEFSIDVDYSNYEFKLNDNFAIQQFEQTDILQKQYNIWSNQPSSFNIYTGRMDYVHRLNKETSVETGVKFSYVNTVNEIVFTNNQNGQLETDLTRSTDFDYTEKVGAGYVTLKTKWMGFDTQLGLRAEQTHYNGFSGGAQLSIERDYFRVFPNVSLHHSLWENYQFGFDYSYRIDRPAYNDLYPYVFYFDPFAGQKGNPMLLPQFTHNFQFSQTIAKDLAINLGYSTSSQYIAFVILLKEDRVSEYSIKKNFDTYQNYYLTVNVPIRISKNWTINSNINLFYNRFNTQFLDDVYKVGKFSGIVTLTQNITLPWDLTGEITTVYNAPNVSGLIQTAALGSVNIGLQKKVFNQKGSFRLNVTDIFYTNRATYHVVYPGLDVHFYNYPETRIIRINFTYNIGKTVQAMRKHNGQDEERKRVGVN
ncbi:Outer membrane receptor proteins, mostly Fe transport [Chryseolinea serpens]|uniref:Outer membrane receptor proteins, mostly Fe transport n=1 Tax=Chryseolinea serpens TaxID=947013 RepID=A0A1M5NZK5_9BACT|nr:outer membrane beta-barrel protein [Chryseolinea serpens]SHG95006.1 Outer membrane receptor proteins, mostly Fe transport [Chryseolinea serpens]